MRFLHCSDLHLGRRLYEYDLAEDQRYILNQMVQIAEDEKADAVLVAGDVYDKGVPTLDAVGLLDDFLTQLSQKGIGVYIISGNHDSADRLSFGGRLLEASGIHLASGFKEGAVCYELQDQYGPLRLWSLPFVRPSAVRPLFADREIANYTEAVQALVEKMNLDPGSRNLLMAHQFVTASGKGPEASGSESMSLSVGTLDNVEASVFAPFDYVALGHIHSPQSIGRPEVRYCGAPLAYSISESKAQKTVTLVDMGPKEQVQIREIPLEPLRPVRGIRGTLEQLLTHGEKSEDYIYAQLTDEVPPLDCQARLQVLYPNLVNLRFAPLEKAVQTAGEGDFSHVAQRSPVQLFEEFFERVHGRVMNEQEQTLLEEAMGKEAEG